MKIFKKASVGILALPLILGLLGPASALAAGPAPINLGTAGNYVILAKSGISTTGTTAIVGDLGISPAAATSITGFGLVLPAAGAYSTSALVTGNIYAPDYADPTPANLTTAVLDMQTAFTDAAGRTNPTETELGGGNIGSRTIAPGLYKWDTNVLISADVTLSGGANDVWIFQIAQNLDISAATKIILSGGAQASNIFWQVSGQASLGTTAVFNGNILAQTAIVMNTGSTLNGRALAQTAVTLDASTVTIPSSATPTPTPAVTPTPTPTPTTVPAVPATPAIPSAPPSMIPATPAVPATPADPRVVALQAQIAALLANLQTLQAQRAAQQGTPAPASAFGQQVRAIATDLKQGSRGGDVTILQQFLISQEKGPATQALAGVGATAYFGAMTRAALAEFQAQAGINPALGNFGSITRAYLSQHY
ncbi:hypothetical protein A2662_00965 [Candidatus Giovannonibacteria bacterium RIFCSPHIGHO2_01_FULL_45_33]|nr:MAG: hypothetical protein A2662_00965 [Candidatus Giovannonibacteria bacterium RIFCSPHIGHO2_01_FULL_45_33]